MYLEKIVAHKRNDPAFVEASRVDWVKKIQPPAAPAPSFVQSLRATPPGTPSIIAEMKRASPSKGSFQFKGQVQEQTRAYEEGGARAVSVLTNEHFFQGELEDLRRARRGTQLPLLRKDFLLESWELAQAAAYGANVVLLIAAILDQPRMEQLITEAHRLELEVLLEIHDAAELDRVLELPEAPEAIGINNRNLNTFEVSLDTTERLAPRIPKEICRVSESGFATREDLLRFQGVVDAFLIGESLMRSPRPAETLQGWIKG